MNDGQLGFCNSLQQNILNYIKKIFIFTDKLHDQIAALSTTESISKNQHLGN